MRRAAGVLAFHAVVSGGPVATALLHVSGRWPIPWQSAFDGLSLALMALQLAIAALPLWRSPWPRVVLAVLVALAFGDYILIGDLSRRFASFPLETSRDVADFAVQGLALTLLFLPAASRWYRRPRE